MNYFCQIRRDMHLFPKQPQGVTGARLGFRYNGKPRGLKEHTESSHI